MPLNSYIPLALAILSLTAVLDAEEFLTDPPPRSIPVEEVEWDELSNSRTGPKGEIALSIDPDKWRHAETENYILHFRRITEAKKVARELEFNIWFVAGTLQAPKEDYSSKSHAFIFEDEEEWKEFVSRAELPAWSASIAHGDELFLDVRSSANARRFDSNTLAHEATHAVIARLYPRQPWPLWLNEGFAEYMAAAGVAARKNQTVGRHLGNLPYATIPLNELVLLEGYPENPAAVSIFYQSGEKFVRFLMLEFPPARFKDFVDAILKSGSLEPAVMEVYGDKVESFEDFMEAYRGFKV